MSDPEPNPSPSTSYDAFSCDVDVDAEAYEVDESLIRSLAGRICAALGVEHHELSVSFVESDAIRVLNKEFRGKDKSTDVLSFPQQEFAKPRSVKDEPLAKVKAKDGPQPLLGDIVISLTDAEANAKDIGQSLDREVAFLLVHGVLHLCGHDHEAPEEEALMLSEQREIMAKLSEPSATWTGCARGTSPT